MSAVRMVAYGVLEMKHKSPPDITQLFSSQVSTPALEQERKEDFERDQLRKLVNDELRRYGLLLARKVVPKNDKWPTKANAHVLYGQVENQNRGFPTRQVLNEGDFKECCEVAAKLLDELDASQETGT